MSTPAPSSAASVPASDVDDLVVIGGGVVGATVAASAARRGLRVTLFEAGQDIGAGCSYANAALIAPDHVAPLATPKAMGDATQQLLRRPSALKVNPDPTLVPWLAQLTASARPARAEAATIELRRLAHRSAELHAALHAEGISTTHQVIGALDVWLRESALPATALSPAQLREIEPTLGAVSGGVHHPSEAITESRSYVREQLADAKAHGARIEFGTSVLGLETSGGAVTGVRLEAGVHRAGHAVVCTGLDGALAEDVDVKLPLRGGRGYVIDLVPSDETPSHAVRFAEHRVVVTPLSDRVRVAGYMEFGAENRPVDTERARALVSVTARGLPAMSTRPVMDVWAGERPCTPDGVPVIGRTQAAEGLSFALGHGMWGLILAPVTAELILDGMSDPALAPALLSPDRFTRG
ncbi:NAD(P)/FAD-dependent oxidoreductase [Dermacoccaceae bacterium W4C1]